MKIEIEFEDVERLKRKIGEQNGQIDELEKTLKALNPDKLKEDAVNLAKKLFTKYMECTFRELGFEMGKSLPEYPFYQNSGSLEYWLGDNWFDTDKVKVTLGATVTNMFKRAFISFGIKPEGELPSPKGV